MKPYHRHLPVLLMTLTLAVACQPKKKESSDIISGGSGGTTGSSSGGSTTPGVVTDTTGVMFVTTASVDGGYGYDNTKESYENFDSLCATEAASRNLTGSYKAFINTLDRRPCNSGDCGNATGTSENLKWVLKANTTYKRIDGTVIGTTNANGIFNFPLTNAISPTSVSVWTGFLDYWTFSTNDQFNCAHFRYNSGGAYYAPIGDAGATSASLLNTNSLESCSNSHKVICAKILAVTTTYAAQAAHRRMFVTTATRDGETPSGNTKATLDGFCQTEAASRNIHTGGKTKYKALYIELDIQQSNKDLRKVCNSVSCTTTADAFDWPLEPSRQYRRIDGTIIASANAYGYFTYPLTNSITGDSTEYWTGIPENWSTAISAENVTSCTGWGTNDPRINLVSGFVGVGNQIDKNAISETVKSCNTQLPYLCVEQTRSSNVFYEYPGYDL